MSKQPGKPRYLQIAEEMRDQIARGTYAAGDRIPTKQEMMAQWGVALNTVDRAIAELRERGLVETFHGVGTFVRAQEPAAPSAEDELRDLRGRVAVLETCMEEVYSNLGLTYHTTSGTPSAEEAV